MQRIKKQFGKRFAEALGRCPTLVDDLAAIRKHGVRIRKVKGHCQAYSNRSKNTIFIGEKCSLTYKLISLAHEKVHVLDSPTPDAVPGLMSREQFIGRCLEAETDAIVHEVKVTGELLAAGFAVEDHSMKWFKRYKKSGRPAIRRAIEKAVTSTTGEKYPDYYGLWYDEVAEEDFDLAMHRFAGGKTVARKSRRRLLPAGQDLCPRFCISCQTRVSLGLPEPVEALFNSGKDKR